MSVTLSEELEASIVDLFALLLRSAPGDLSRTAASVLRAIAEAPRRVTALAEAQHVAQPTMTVLVGRLESRGFVTREPDPADRRASLVRITDAGREAVRARRRARTDVLAQRLLALSEADRDAVRAALPALHALSTQEPPPA